MFQIPLNHGKYVKNGRKWYSKNSGIKYAQPTHRNMTYMSFLIQKGDEERDKSMTISYLCDRYTTNTSKSQAGFIDFIVKPLYETVTKFIPGLDLTAFEINKAKWAELTDFYEEELKIIRNKAIESGNESDSASDSQTS